MSMYNEDVRTEHTGVYSWLFEKKDGQSLNCSDSIRLIEEKSNLLDAVGMQIKDDQGNSYKIVDFEVYGLNGSHVIRIILE